MWRAILVALQFSSYCAFNIGWREFNIGNWLSRLTRTEYSYKAVGFVRTAAGIQSLMSVFLIALWALTYFARPFL